MGLTFTYECSNLAVTFLDTEIYIADGLVHTTLHRKTTATNSVLHAESHHPRKLVWSIPYGEFLRIRRNCSETNKFNRICEETKQRFIKRKYPKKMVQLSLQKATEKTRVESLKKNTKENQGNQIRFITNYSLESKQMHKILEKNWKLLQMDPTLRNITGTRPQITYRRARNIKDQLVRSHFTSKKQNNTNWLSERGFIKCNKCKACKIGRNTKEIKTRSGYMKQINKKITCKSEFVIYVIECPCKKKYVGSTTCKLHKRILEHIRAVQNKDRSYATAKHMEQHHGGKWELMKYFAVEQVPKWERGGNRELNLRCKESRWILALDTIVPNGLNLDAELHVHLG